MVGDLVHRSLDSLLVRLAQLISTELGGQRLNNRAIKMDFGLQMRKLVSYFAERIGILAGSLIKQANGLGPFDLVRQSMQIAAALKRVFVDGLSTLHDLRF